MVRTDLTCRCVTRLLDLRSGYTQRALDRMPQQGSKFPWRVYQSYLQDYRATRRASIDDGVMQFTNPVTPAAHEAQVAG